jgi:hypothetical protein
VRPIFENALADLVESDHRVSETVWLEPTPGHTPGHVTGRSSCWAPTSRRLRVGGSLRMRTGGGWWWGRRRGVRGGAGTLIVVARPRRR